MLLRMTWSPRSTASLPDPGFNEAGAMLLRMTLDPGGEVRNGRRASMRPEQCCSG